MKNKNTIVIYLLSLFALLSCGEDRTQEFFEQTKENQWIYTTMKESYLWKEQIKPQERSKFFVPESKFFSSLLYKDDKASFFAELVYAGDYGMSVALMRDPIAVQPSKVYALVLFVEPDSPAGVAGVKRGMWISAINGKALSTSSSAQLQSGEEAEFTVEYIEYDDKLWVEIGTIKVGASASYDVLDIYADNIYSERGKNIGYILCNSFSNDDFKNRVNEIAEKFIAQNVTDVVVDLRYNSGGSIDNAAYLASALVSSELAGTPFCTLKKSESELYSTQNYISTQYNLCDKKIYFITGEKTKGVAELLVTSVNASRGAYDVMVVGGKSVGSNVMVERMESPYGFSINPAVAYAYSSDGNLVSNKGIMPDYEIDELANKERNIYELGNQQEELLYNTIYIITNGTAAN